jgi:hypothetical protein
VPHKLHSHEKRNKRASGTPDLNMPYDTPPFFAVHLASYKSLLCTAPLPHSPVNPSVPISIPTLNQFPSGSTMLMPPKQGGPVKSPADPLVLYSQSLRDYTLRLWMESRRQAEERVRARAHKKHHDSTKASGMPSRKVSTGVEDVTSISNEGSTLAS